MSPESRDPTALMAAAVEASVQHVESGGLPFVGVVITTDGWISAPGVNLVRETGDPSAHAEIVAMRKSRHLPIAQGLRPFVTYLQQHVPNATA